jgi:DNA-directed RNA polymerase subunit RPC12/RpoP
MIRIACSNCQKSLSLDETKLPTDREVTLTCPVCQHKILVDRRTLEGGAADTPAPAAPQQADDDHANEFGAKALIVGVDDPAIRHAAKLIGFLPVVFADPAKAREFYLQEFPQVVFIHPPQITPPPLESMNAIIALLPVDRRKSFFVLIADNLRTLDGNAAFLYGMNLIVSKKDLGQFPAIYREAHVVHERLYASMNTVLRERQSG